MNTGKLDKNGDVIKLGDKISLENHDWRGIYTVNYGIGTYDSGIYEYLGWYLTNEDGDSDGFGWILTFDSSNLEIVQSITLREGEETIPRIEVKTKD